MRGRLRGTTKLEDFADRDLVVEAIIEQLPLKKNLYGALDKICGPVDTFCEQHFFAFVTEMATATKRADNFVGLHFFNPVPVMKLVEVIRTIASDPKVYDDLVAFGDEARKNSGADVEPTIRDLS